ncbi:hypothetical protein JRQ81_011154 [Phrynocephalus forsythii]|uniref:Uncharacterized protein n=1 Tax=Phrynocephalus forsythii TaxID=171643 RepID=A0A9Q0X7J7_9SAUR|nr:hypothetical protein JRQ81_011154 [Phrynocephalus forsythii]
MNTLITLSILCFTLALCHGFCFRERPKLEFKDGKFVIPNTCVDKYDGTEHLVGSAWNTGECMKCECTKGGMSCCSRYGGIAKVEGCEAVRDPETCTYKFFKNNDPSKPCF